MVRRRRSAEEARAEILAAAEHLLTVEGPSALTLKRVAQEVGISHPGVLHHFRSVELLGQALHARLSTTIRNDLLSLFRRDTGVDRITAMQQAMDALSDPRKGRLLAWLVATGRDPFPDASDEGLRRVAQALTLPGQDPAEVRYKLMLVVLSMVGESLVGDAVRVRLALSETEAAGFHRWLLGAVLTGGASQPSSDTDP
jgi:TetR/AcrR family transcriptional regulator, repressor for neighboring sulfatase